MLVSSHTISVWHDWAFVPRDIASLFTDKTGNDLIVFVPKVVQAGVHLPEFLKLLDVGEGTILSYGTVYVGKGKLLGQVPEAVIEAKTETASVE